MAFTGIKELFTAFCRGLKAPEYKVEVLLELGDDHAQVGSSSMSMQLYLCMCVVHE